jgi:protein-disulfide isomerase
MSERKVGMALLVIFGLFWWIAPAVKRDPTQCDILPDSSALIEEVASVKGSLTVQPDHITEVAEMIDPIPSPSEKPHEKQKREVLIFVSNNCPPCEKWKRCEMQKFMDAGWSVGIVEVHSYGLTPTFEIEANGKKQTIKGYASFEQISEAVR